MNGAPKQVLNVISGSVAEAHFRAGDLARVSRDEVVHRLLRRQPRERGHHARGVAGEEDDVRRVPPISRAARCR